MPDLVIGLSYYAPYVSGLTETARLLAEGLVSKGWKVKVVTSRHLRGLPEKETIEGVEVVRCRTIARVGRGNLTPTLASKTIAASRSARLLHLHLPMLEAGFIAKRRLRVPIVCTYHCDVQVDSQVLKPGVPIMDLSSRMALRSASAVVVSSQDYAKSSRLADSLRGRRTVAIPPPCVSREPGSPTFRRGKGPHVGFLGRIVFEKGLEYLIEAFRRIDDPEARLLVGGETERLAGSSVIDSLKVQAAGDDRVSFLGFIEMERLSDFYASIDVLALPSVNPLEAFGIVQVEAMMLGVPAVVSDLPGVREPVRQTGFGVVVPPRDPAALLSGLQRVLQGSGISQDGSIKAKKLFGLDRCLDSYSQLFESVRQAG